MESMSNSSILHLTSLLLDPLVSIMLTAYMNIAVAIPTHCSYVCAFRPSHGDFSVPVGLEWKKCCDVAAVHSSARFGILANDIWS